MYGTATAAAMFMGLASAAPAPPAEAYLPSTGWPPHHEAAFMENWFGGQLRAMGEPVLSSPAARAGFIRRFRMLVLPTFHHAYSIRVDEPIAGPPRVRAVRLDGAGGYSPGRVLEQESYVAGRAGIRRLQRAIARVRLAELSREEGSQDEDGVITVCADGVRFVFELVDERGSHFVTRGCGMDPPLWDLVDAADAFRRSVGSDLKRYR